MLEKTGAKSVSAGDGENAMGHSIHEMETERMGKDPKTSFLNATINYRTTHCPGSSLCDKRILKAKSIDR